MGRLNLRVLGPLEAELDGKPVVLGRRKQRALLALLARDANRLVSTDTIVDELWPRDPPATARHSVEVYASGLRRALGGGRLERRSGGYVLRVEPGELDAARLATTLAGAERARAARARRMLEEALEGVGGETLAGLEELPFVVAERARTAELVLAAREVLLDARLELGEHEQLIGELRALVARHPTRERLRRQLMLALYRAGRQQDALAAYRDAARALRDLGLTPGSELRALERRILQDDGALQAPPAELPLSTLPAPMNPLLGRERELRELAALLRSDARLVTLTGPGGVGKTRLAIAVGNELLAEIGACFFVALASVGDPGAVLAEVASALDVHETAGEPLEEKLKRRLRDRETLLVLDNVEHVLEGATGLSSVLAACPGLRVLATSRTPLQLYGEYVYDVQPLPVPAPAAGEDEIAAAPSVVLFAARARAVRPGFAVTADNAETVADICRRVDGLPLGLELAAGRVGLLSPELLLERLAHRLDVGEGPRDAPPRQRTLQATLAWSYELLDRRQQAIFRSLGVFVGGATADAIGHVCALGADLTAELQALIVHNLVRQKARDRYELLETARKYARAQLEAHGESQPVRARHVDYFVALAEAADHFRDQRPEVVARYRLEHSNFLAAAGYAADAGRGDLELRLLGALWNHFTHRPTYGEGRRLLESSLARHDDVEPAIRARAAMAAALLGVYERHPGAQERAREALRLGEEVGDDLVQFKALDSLAVAAHLAGDSAAQQAFAERALALARRLGDPWLLGTALNNRALPFLDDPEAADAARAWLVEAAACFSAIDSRDGVAYAHGNLGILAARRGERADAAAHYVTALEHALGVSTSIVLDVLGRLGALLAALGDTEAAATLQGALERGPSVSAVVVEEAHEQARLRGLAAVRAQLAERDGEAAATAGQELTFEGLVEYAFAAARPHAEAPRRAEAAEPR